MVNLLIGCGEVCVQHRKDGRRGGGVGQEVRGGGDSERRPGNGETDPGPHPGPEGSLGRPCLHSDPRGDAAKLYQGGQLRLTLRAGCACQEPRKVYLLDFKLLPIKICTVRFVLKF